MPKKNNTPKREMTRRQMSHHEKESRLQRYFLLGGIIVIIVVILVVGTGIYMNKYKPFQETAIKVGNTEYNVGYYIDALSYYATSIGGAQASQYISQLASQGQVTQLIEQDALILDEAAKLGITASDADINKYISDNKITPVNQAVKDIVHAQLVVTKLKSAYFDKQIPASGPQRDIMAMFLESQAQVDQMKAQLEGGATFNQLAQNYSLESNTKSKSDFGLAPQGVVSSTLNSTVLETAAFNSSVQQNVPNTVADPTQSKSVGYWLLKVTDTQANADGTTQLHVWAMLLSSEEQARDIKAQLDNGADFATLSTANSQYSTVPDGDLSFTSKGTLGDAVDAVLFPSDASKALPLNTVSEPVKDTSRSSTGGVWLYEVTGIQDNATIDGTNRDTLINNKLNEWINKIWTADQSSVHTYLTDSQTNFAVTQAESR